MMRPIPKSVSKSANAAGLSVPCLSCTPPALNDLHLPPFVLVGAGAVGNALAYVLTHLENRDTYAVLVDDDVYDKSNLNRCSLAGTGDLNQEKTAVLASRLEEVGIASFPFSGDLKRFVNDGRVGMRADVAEDIGAGVYRMVVSCVDKGDGRQKIYKACTLNGFSEEAHLIYRRRRMFTPGKGMQSA
jgi:molybdopterin/thiamine biosynthesis adenylyltransferase